MRQANYANGFKLTLQPHALELPLKWKKRQRIFVNSMSDLFHKSVPVEYIQCVFDVMRRADWHQYQILTKRSERLLELDPLLMWEPHIWMGVSVENEDYTFRIDGLPSRPFSMTTLEPAKHCQERADAIRRASRQRFGRPTEQVERELRAAYAG
jgi:protein gp37